MPFIAHTAEDIAAMLASIGCNSIADLYAEIPQELQISGIKELAPPLSELQATQLLQQRARQDACKLNFIGAGCYEHYIPAAVWDLASRGEYLTAYTPYQAEASQGTLQVMYEFQSMIANLTALDVANASMYDGATALAEAILMAVRCAPHDRPRKILIPTTIHPFYRQVVHTLVSPQQIELVSIGFDIKSGRINKDALTEFTSGSFVALVIPQPNFFGVLEEVDFFTNWAQQQQGSVIALVNPLALGLLNPPGTWGENGADIACGEAQPLGVPLSSGGPYVGFLACKKSLIRQLPGRLVGMTTDLSGKRGFTLTLQAREQHIRRAKATSNICTNQGLLATVVTIYLSLMGATGLQQVAKQCHLNAMQLKKAVAALRGFEIYFDSPFFHEIVIKLPRQVSQVQDILAKQGIQAGFDVSQYYPELTNGLLCCVTETKNLEDIQTLARELAKC